MDKTDIMKERVAFVSGIFPAISEPFLVNLAVGLIEEGVNLRVFANDVHVRAKHHKNFERHDLSTKISYFPKPTINSIGKDLVFQLKRLGLHRFLAIHSGIVLKRAEYKLARVRLHPLLEFEPTTLYCNFIGTGVSYMFLREIGLVNKLIVGVYGGDVTIRGLNYPYHKLFEIADQFIAISNHIKARLIQLGCAESKISVIPLPVEVDEFEMKQADYSTGMLHVLSVGRLVEKKGFIYGIKAVEILIKNGMALTYTIVGDGPLRSELQNVIIESGLEEIVKLVGAKNHYELQDYYQQADLVLVPSITAKNGDMEGQVVVIQEAGLVGLPVIASLHNGIPDGVVDGDTGFLVPEKDVAKIAEALQILYYDPKLRVSMGNSHREFVVRRYSREVVSQQILDTLAHMS